MSRVQAALNRSEQARWRPPEMAPADGKREAQPAVAAAGNGDREPAARLVSRQKMMLELKLLAVAARCAEALAAGRRVEVRRAEVEQLETRVMRRLEEHEKSIAEIEQAANDALIALRAGFESIDRRLTAARRDMEAHPDPPAVLEHRAASA